MWEIIRANQRKSWTLVLLMAGVLFILGYLLAEYISPGMGLLGLLGAWFIWLIQVLISYYAGDNMFLSLSGAREITHEEHPTLWNVVEEMSIASGLPWAPKVYIIDDPAPNAFATGRNPESASVAVTKGLLDLLDRDELQGVIAHEIGHIKNQDTLLMLMMGTMLGTIVMLADTGYRVLGHGSNSRHSSSGSRDGGSGQVVMLILALVFMIIAPILAQLIYHALSRRREYLADASSALFTRYPEGLAGALEKIVIAPHRLQRVNRVTAPMYIINPKSMIQSAMSDFSDTHPSTSERIMILRAMGGGAGYVDYERAFKEITGQQSGVIPASAVAETEGAGITVSPPAPDTRSHVERVRETSDSLWKLNHYSFIPCACGTTLKIPPQQQNPAYLVPTAAQHIRLKSEVICGCVGNSPLKTPVFRMLEARIEIS